jgi:hypothetical protein
LGDQESAGGAVPSPERRAARGIDRPGLDDDFDFSTPEGEAAIRAALALVLEVRETETSPLARRVQLYERTLGLAVIPVLVRRTILAVKRRGLPTRHGSR